MQLTGSRTTTSEIYDTLTDGGLDASKWTHLTMDVGNGEIVRCEEPSARTTVQDGYIEVRVPEFERHHHTIQLGDCPKHLLFSTRTFPLEPGTVATFGVEMTASSINGNPLDCRDGFASFNVFDPGSGSVWDHAITGLRHFSISEQLTFPESGPPVVGFSHVVEAPLMFQPRPQVMHQYTIEIDTTAGRVQWFADDQQVFEVRDQQVPAEVLIGFGLITLHPIRDGRTTSLRGQGMAGRWRRFEYATHGA
jgi:hypothetical protein